MALNQIPYTNVHELNLDWILAKIKQFENEIHEFEDYASEIADLRSKIESINAKISSINHTLVQLNLRCTNLEDALDDTRDSINNLRDQLLAQINDLHNELNSVEALYYSLKAYNDTSNTIVYNNACRYADAKFREFVQWVSDPRLWMVISPFNNRLESIQTVIDEIYTYMQWSSVTTSQFDSMQLTCEYLDNIGYTCTDFDFYGRFALLFAKAYVTEDMLVEYVKREELEHYALKTELDPLATKESIKIYNPMTGIRGTAQQAIDALASLHQCGNNCITLDGLDYTASDYDAIGFSAYEFDFKGLIKTCGLYIDPTTGVRSDLQQILNNIVGAFTLGLTATQFDSMNLDCDTFDGYEISAYDFDYNSIPMFASSGDITVLTGISADQYQNIYVGNFGILYTI